MMAMSYRTVRVHRNNQHDQEQTTAYRDSSGPNSRSDAHCATIFGDWEEPSGESRLGNVGLYEGALQAEENRRRGGLQLHRHAGASLPALSGAGGLEGCDPNFL